MAQIKFSNNNPVFFNTLRKRVNAYFTENQIKQTGNNKLFFKTIILFATLFTSYVWLVFFTPAQAFFSIGICVIMGLTMAAIGFNVFHDGAHGSYSENKFLNNVMSCSLNLLGGSSFIWKHKHNINHHSYTNIEGMDDDIDIEPLLRTNASQQKKWFHKFQHIYSFALYCLTYVFWVYYNDFKKYFSGKVSKFSPLKKMSVTEHIMFWVTKLVYTYIFILLPAQRLGWGNLLTGYAVVTLVCGVVIAYVFQLAHIHDDADFVAPDDVVYTVENEWAIHQINTTINFDTKSKVIGWFCGGLNFQVEHHLFPKISHIHYPEINKIVKQTCEEFNIAYKEFPTVFSAIKSHLFHLRKLGIAA